MKFDKITRSHFFTIFQQPYSANMEESKDLTILKVYFPQADSVLYKTTVLYAWYDILSDYGGILGLCLGCSIISILELIYFLTFRSYQNIFNNNRFLKKFNAANQNVFAAKPTSLMNPKFEFLHWESFLHFKIFLARI